MLERLAPLLLSLIGKDFGVFLRRVKRNSVLYLIAGLFLLTAYFTLVFAVYLLLAYRYGEVAAAFGVAVGALILAVCTLITMVLLDQAEKRRVKPQAPGGGLLALGAVTLLPAILRSRALTGIVTLGVIALLASRVPPPGGGKPGN